MEQTTPEVVAGATAGTGTALGEIARVEHLESIIRAARRRAAASAPATVIKPK